MENKLVIDTDLMETFFKLSKFDNHKYFQSDYFENYLKKTFNNDKGRYLLFNYYSYYPCGGMEDLIVRTDSIEEIIDLFKYIMTQYNEYTNSYVMYYDLEKNEYERIKNYERIMP